MRRVGENCQASTLMTQSYFQLWLVVIVVELLGTREKEKLRSDDQEQEDIDGTGEVEQRVGEERNRRRYTVATEL